MSTHPQYPPSNGLSRFYTCQVFSPPSSILVLCSPRPSSTMRTFNFVFTIILAVLSCTSIAMIGAMPTRNGPPTRALHLRQFPQRCEAIPGLCEICAQVDENKLQPRKICDSKTCTAANKLYIFWCEEVKEGKEDNVTAQTSRVQTALTRIRHSLTLAAPLFDDNR